MEFARANKRLAERDSTSHIKRRRMQNSILNRSSARVQKREPRAITTSSCPGIIILRSLQRIHMNITAEAAATLSPDEMREARRLAGLNFETLSRFTDISKAQLSQYENARNGLREDQLQLCKQILLGAAVERAERIQTFIAREQEKAAQSAALRYANSAPISSTDRISQRSGFSSGLQS